MQAVFMFGYTFGAEKTREGGTKKHEHSDRQDARGRRLAGFKILQSHRPLHAASSFRPSIKKGECRAASSVPSLAPSLAPPAVLTKLVGDKLSRK